MALKTFAEMNTLLADNTSGDIAAVDMRDVIKGLWRRQIAPYTNDDAADVYWESNSGDFTTVTVTGSQTITEREGFLSVLFAGQAGADVNAFLKARTFSIGDAFATRIRIGGLINNHNMTGICFTDGTASTSNVALALAYYGDSSNKISAWHGTLTNLATNVNLFDSQQLQPYNDGIYAKLIYSAADTFEVQWSWDGVSFSNLAGTTFAKTMTPTHVGVCWSKWGGADDGLASFGPICKLA